MGEKIERLRADFDDKLSELRDASADMLCHIADKLDDGRFRAAAAILRGRRVGRRSIDDTAALAYAEKLLRLDMVRSPHQACESAAKVFAMPHQIPAMRDRLRRKFRTK